MGPFVSAYIKTHDNPDQAREQAAQWLETFHDNMKHIWTGQIPEITEAEAPYRSRGCIAQAWSVAELLRAAVEDVYQIKSRTANAA